MAFLRRIFWVGYDRITSVMNNEKGEFGVGSVLSIAVALIVSAFVLVPGMRNFADLIIDGMTAWWGNTISGNIFPTT
jgi:cell division protein FtsW (lipid II flippase)